MVTPTSHTTKISSKNSLPWSWRYSTQHKYSKLPNTSSSKDTLRICITFYLWQLIVNNSNEQISSWEANRFSASQEIPRILRNLKVHYRNHMRPPPVSIPSQTNLAHAFPTHFLKFHFNIILPFILHLPSGISFTLPHQNPARTSPLPHTCYMPRLSHSSWFNHPKNIWWGAQNTKLLVLYSFPFPYHLVPLRPKYS